MKVIVGLGNIGEKYAKTRHNVGFIMLDELARQNSGVFRLEKKFLAAIAEITMYRQKVLLVKPQTYMNTSGQAIREVIRFYKLDPERDLLVIYDDLDLPVAAVRYREKGSSGGHNGIKSTIEELNTNNFSRIRIGIGRPEDKSEVGNYVLSNFGKKELAEIYAEYDQVQKIIAEFLKKEPQ